MERRRRNAKEKEIFIRSLIVMTHNVLAFRKADYCHKSLIRFIFIAEDIQ